MTFLDVNIDTSKIVDQLNAIATPAIKELLATYVKQAVVQGNVDVSVGHWMIGIAIGLVVLGIILFGLAATISGGYDDEAAAVAIVFGFILIIIGLVVGGFGIGNVVQGTQELANPQYYAIQNLLGQVHQ